MIDFERENMISLREAAKLFPTGAVGKALNIATIWRWVGKRNNRLETVKIGGRRFTSKEAIARFIERSNAKTPAATTKPAERAQNAGNELRKLIGGANV